jgi:hypothetical protein
VPPGLFSRQYLEEEVFWEVHFREPATLFIRGPENARFPGGVPNPKPYILWCCINIRCWLLVVLLFVFRLEPHYELKPYPHRLGSPW